MKKVLLTALFGVFVSLVSSAQVAKAVKVVNLKTPTVQCEMCKSTIETYLKRIDGVTFVNAKPKAKSVQVKYMPDRTNEEMIIAAIANAGYDVGEGDSKIAANPDAYKALPKCCKKPEDGGGMPKH
jgi:copper chaperone CopZ